MQKKHVDIRIKQCIVLAEASNCPRRKFGALLLDPLRNVILMDGYNGGPRGGTGPLCRGSWCERDGLLPEDVVVTEGTRKEFRSTIREKQVCIKGERVWARTIDQTPFPEDENSLEACTLAAEEERSRILGEWKPIPSGTRLERGCHHAESNVICNAAANGVPTKGSWLIVTGEPCLMCAKLIHHAGITKVLCVQGGYKGGDEGPKYLRVSGVSVEYVEGPKDPRQP